MLSAVIVTFRRPDALARTLRELQREPLITEVVVVDNASCDSTLAMLTRDFPRVRVVSLDANLGVEAFNRGAAASRGDTLLILDDDAWPAPNALSQAMALLDREPGVHAVALLPVHPQTRTSEWPFATRASGGWPVMGCGNLVRRDAWERAGGYEASFFLYRNDVDLALKLLGLGMEVRFDPAWVVYHDSPAAARKSERWLRLATRNWVWLARRHGRGVWKWIGILAGVARAVHHAGLFPARLAAVIHGAVKGLHERPETTPAADGRAYRTFLSLRRGPA